MIKVVLLPEDIYFECNIMQLRRSKSIDHVDVVVDGRAYLCKDVRVLALNKFGYSLKLSLGELRVDMCAITRVTFYPGV